LKLHQFLQLHIMNATQLLSGYGLTLEAATNWVMSNLNSPTLIFETAKTFGITSSMLAEIVAPVVG
jgi:hypothetical protein